MKPESDLKGIGYLTSTVSVFLLALPSLKSAQESAYVMTALILGALLSISGMFLRWRSHRMDKKKEEQQQKQPDRLPASRGRSAAGGQS